MPRFDFGEYAAYIWPAYGLTAAVVLGLVASALGYSRRWKRRAEELGRH